MKGDSEKLGIVLEEISGGTGPWGKGSGSYAYLLCPLGVPLSGEGSINVLSSPLALAVFIR